MPKKIRDVKPPSGFARLAFRAPIWLYKLHLGRLLGHRFLELAHTGRKSGLTRHTVLEVVRYDQASGTYIVAAGFGKRSDWFQNIQANPQVEVKSAGEHIQATAEVLNAEQAGAELVNYAKRHPATFRELVHIMGFEVDGSERDIQALGNFVPLVILRPK